MGRVRLAAPRLAIRTIVAPVLGTLARSLPGVMLDVRTVERSGGFVADGYDLAIQVGGEISHDMVAVAIGTPFVTAIVGSPSYFADRGMPLHPSDLARHACIGCLSGPDGSPYRWLFRKNDEEMTADVAGPIVTDDPDLMLAGALDGIGLWHGIESLALPYIEAGRLERALTDWSPSTPGFFLCYATGGPLSPAVRAVVDLLKESSTA